MPDLLRTLLAPVLLVQGKQMFARMPKLDAPDGDLEGTAGEGPPLRLLLLGDSAAHGYGADTQTKALSGQIVARLAPSRTVTWSMFTRFGSTTAKTLAFARKQDALKVDLAVVAVGLNDVIAGISLEDWLADYRALVEVLRERYSAQRIVVSGLPPVGSFPALPQPMRFVIGRQRDRYDATLEAWAETQPDLEFVPIRMEAAGALEGAPMSEIMAADGFHPGPRIYGEWAERIVRASGLEGE